ncbi:hypothetical protein AB0F11_29935 [Streptomyces sp. NPDC032472]|uniref:hypothetical protein n=1 Tax=Streptomyces sp. NPDC032472 TaxID=3155018 RepID=UPI0033FCB311
MDALQPQAVMCSYCKARPAAGAVRTLEAWEGRLTVTWHDKRCPHHLADRVLAGKEP